MPCLQGAFAVASVERADAAAAKTLGKTNRTPNPSCPRTPCEAVGSVTGFQVTGDGQRGLFKARESGEIVAWAISLSKPNSEQREFFSDFYASPDFGARPTARVSVLKRAKKGRRYKLKRQSPVVELTSALGVASGLHALRAPAHRPRRGARPDDPDLVAVLRGRPPGQGQHLAGESRARRSARGRRTSRTAQPIQKTGSERVFGCDYRTARLLYWGYYVPD